MNQTYLRYALIAAAALAIAFTIWKYRQPRFGGGDQVPDIAMTLANGQLAKLSDLRGKYVLLQFWGSWCAPCRHENPHLIQLYQKYHQKGFEIFSIGIEFSDEAWKKAIINDKMEWPYHAMESVNFDGPLAKQFNIKSIPTTFLLNPEGVIMGVSLSPDYLEKMLSEKL
jgi:thiol-disulfide isomerase/thioredoxin